MSEYGSVRQYAERLREAIAGHGALVVGVSCRSCVSAEKVCAECKPSQSEWSVRALVGYNQGSVKSVPLEELMGAVRS